MARSSEHSGPVLDLRGPATPADRALQCTAALAPGAVAVLLMPTRLPVQLLARLSACGMQVRLDRFDGGLRLNIRRPDIEQAHRLSSFRRKPEPGT